MSLTGEAIHMCEGCTALDCLSKRETGTLNRGHGELHFVTLRPREVQKRVMPTVQGRGNHVPQSLSDTSSEHVWAYVVARDAGSPTVSQEVLAEPLVAV